MAKQADDVFARYREAINMLARGKTIVSFTDKDGNPRGVILPEGVSYLIVNPVVLYNGDVSVFELSPLRRRMIVDNTNLEASVKAIWERTSVDGNGEYYHDDKKLLNNPAPLQVERTDKRLAIFPDAALRNFQFFSAEGVLLLPINEGKKEFRLPDNYEGPLRKNISYLVL